uniref:DUF4283 domain-containing protein n=1 Tax=Solanum tuberosum TaxID=4113 RepID=M1AGV7_SOLTU
MEQVTLKAASKIEGNDLLNRCLGGCFADCVQIPTRNDVRKWAQQMWKGAQNLQVYDINGVQFLFEFQSRKAAQHILLGDWRRQGSRLLLAWWFPKAGAFPDHKTFNWFWIRVLGLPLHLWSEKVMKEIGEKCGGWIENKEETEIKNHLRWARIRVKGPREQIPSTVEVDDGDYTFSLPVRCESPARY